MLLSALVDNIAFEAVPFSDVEITNITDSTNETRPGSLYCCVPGARRDGHDFALEAVARGAVAVVVDHDIGALDVPQIRVSDVRAAMAPLAAAFFADPSKAMRMVGVTGTNGKTTTTQILDSMLRAHSIDTSVIGTLTSTYTSPPATKLQLMLKDFKDAGKQVVVMEVSSHALDQHRVDGVVYEVAIFTNLSQDHLDYHGTMDNYFEAKAKLFEPTRSIHGVVNRDDPWGRKLIERDSIPITSYGLSDADGLVSEVSGSRFTWNGHLVHLPLMGEFNVMNAIAAATAALQMQVPVVTIVKALESLEAVPGRVERIDAGQDFAVFVDFAHTPDGLEKVLTMARATVGQHKLRVVFGCGGDRDVEKRPQMGAIAENIADRVVITSDNPRSEDPAAIASAVAGGMRHPERAHVEIDRRAAITFAIGEAESGDVVIIAGKGHEVTQETSGVKTPFDDRAVAREVLVNIKTESNKETVG